MNDLSTERRYGFTTAIVRDGLTFTDVEDACEISVHGVFLSDGKYRRLPEQVARDTNDGVYRLHTHTAGGRIRFRTDSPYIAIHIVYNTIDKFPHFPLTGSAGLDLYRNNVYIGSYIPTLEITDTYEGIIDLPNSTEADFTLNMPLYSGVSKIYIGIKESASLCKASPYTLDLPVVYYGSSITQGACASRPGNSYQSILSRELNIDYINLGFSGSARGEQAISDYIASLKMSAFVLDYDHNAPTVEHLKATHKNLYDNVRKAHPTLPILMLSRPKFHLTEEEKLRLEVVRESYLSAIADGDRSVYFIPGNELIEYRCAECALVDNCHPGDSGFVSMAFSILPTLKKMLKF